MHELLLHPFDWQVVNAYYTLTLLLLLIPLLLLQLLLLQYCFGWQVLNAFFIMAVVCLLYAIIGTTIFDGVDDQFATLDRSVMLLFR